jgi:biopolymer transport protein ExbD
MKMAAAKQVHYESGPNMTPLVDVVMVILIFLMLAGSFGTGEHYMVSSVPIHASGGGGVAPPPGWTPPVMVDIRIGANGEAYMPANPQVGVDQPAKVFKALEDIRLKFEQEQKDLKEVEIVLRPNDGTRWEVLAPLYDAALRAKFQKVSFAMTK